MFFGIKWTNLGPTSVDLIFYALNVANLGFLKDSTDNCIKVLTIAFKYRQLH